VATFAHLVRLYEETMKISLWKESFFMEQLAWNVTLLPLPDKASDEELVERFQAGDHAAFSDLFRRYNQELCTYLARVMVDEELGRDLAQDTFLIALCKLPSMHEVACFKQWLYRVALNLARDRWRRARLIRWIPLRGISVEEDPVVEGPERDIEESESIAILLKHVSIKYRPCLYLNIIEDMRQDEIASFLDMSERSVRRYIHRGKEELSKAYAHLAEERKTHAKRGVRQ
jgi:RNA polymerase sigma-70 factor (ECF subfamily)